MVVHGLRGFAADGSPSFNPAIYTEDPANYVVAPAPAATEPFYTDAPVVDNADGQAQVKAYEQKKLLMTAVVVAGSIGVLTFLMRYK